MQIKQGIEDGNWLSASLQLTVTLRGGGSYLHPGPYKGAHVNLQATHSNSSESTQLTWPIKPQRCSCVFKCFIWNKSLNYLMSCGKFWTTFPQLYIYIQFIRINISPAVCQVVVGATCQRYSANTLTMTNAIEQTCSRYTVYNFPRC